MQFLNNAAGGISVFIILVSGIILTFKSRFFQFRGLKNVMRRLFGGINTKDGCRISGGGVSARGAVCTALAATIGTGNIVGISGAVAVCGPGVVFWIGVSSIFAMIIKYTEISLTAKYKSSLPDGVRGGTMYAVKLGLKKRFAPLSVCFSLGLIAASFGTGNLIQISTGISALRRIIPQNCNFDEIAVIFCVIAALVTGFLLLGGIKSVSRFCEKTVPFMLGLYVVCSLWVIFSQVSRIPRIFGTIIGAAFNPAAFTGGAVTSLFLTVKTGIVRGIISNEAGLGSSTVAHAASDEDPLFEGELGIAEVFIDTGICVLTALVILLGNRNIVYGADSGLFLAANGFYNSFGEISNYILSLFLMFFALSSVVGWGAYGVTASEFLCGNRGGLIYVLIFSAACLLGGFISVDKIWSVSEILNLAMCIPNLTAIFLLLKKQKIF